MNSVSRLIFLASIMVAIAAAQINVLTANYDTDRTNSNNSETILNPATVNAQSFGKLGTLPVDGEIYAQPLYVSGVAIAGHLHNVIYAATMHDSVYAFDADAIASGAPLWKVNLGTSIPASAIQAPPWLDGGHFTDVDVEVGILSTPVIDLGQQAIYLVSETVENGNPTFTLHALSLADGHEIANGPSVIAGSVSGTGDGGQTVQFNATQQLQRPGVALLNRELYVAFGSHGDAPPWHGWLFAYDASNLQNQLAILCTSPNGTGSSIWQSGRAPAIDDGGGVKVTRAEGSAPLIQDGASLYVATGNGDYDGMTNFGESMLRLSPIHLDVMDWFTPDNFVDLTDGDRDLGSSGIILVPGTNLLVTAGKSGNVYLTPRSDMGHTTPANSATSQSFNVTSTGIWDTALWNNQSGPTLYVASAYGGPLEAFRITNGVFSTQVQSQTPSFPTYFAGIAISSDSGRDGTGIVWLTTADVNQNPAVGVLSAFDADDLTHLLWSSTTSPTRDAPGVFAKFVPPTVVNGKVFVPTFSNQLAVYGLLTVSSKGPSK
ncbi:MAG: hypothetical protein ABSB86_01480 [Bryobacteraceae bacterium]|jgi:hypothetical protein